MAINEFHFAYGPAYTMGTYKRVKWTTSETPGPGRYDPGGIDKTTSPRWRMDTTSPRDPLQPNKNPGPGDYKDPQLSRGPAFLLGKRENEKINRNSPGPGYYYPKSQNRITSPIRSFGYRFDTEFERHIDTEIPGPGQYFPEVVSRGPSPTIGAGDRHKIESQAKTPGPGNYSPKEVLVAPGAKFGKESRNALTMFERTAQNPGPGHYNPQNPILETKNKGTSIKGKYTDLAADKNPGPGHYSTAETMSKRAYSVGRGLRPPLDLQDPLIPGPGTYQVNADGRGAVCKFGRSKRTGLAQRGNNTPGPGSYLQIFKTQDSKAQIDILKPNPRPTFTLTGQRSMSPGPGSYDINFRSIMPQSPSFGLGVGKRGILNDNIHVPGPGEYTLPSTEFDGPKYSIKGLWKKRVIRSAFFEAGPGSYDIPHSIGALPKYQLRDKKKKIKLYESEEQTPNIMV